MKQNTSKGEQFTPEQKAALVAGARLAHAQPEGSGFWQEFRDVVDRYAQDEAVKEFRSARRPSRDN